MGIEPMTSSLPRMRSTTELRRLIKSGRRDSNPQHLAWKASTLPLSYTRLASKKSKGKPCKSAYGFLLLPYQLVLGEGFEPS